MFSRTLALSALALVAVTPVASHATVSVGQIAFDFTKNQLVNGAAGPTWTLTDHHGQIVILFVLGFD